MASGPEDPTMIVELLEELPLDGGLAVTTNGPVDAALVDTDPWEALASLVGGVLTFQFGRFRCLRKLSSSLSDELLSGDAEAGRRSKQLWVNILTKMPLRSMNQFSKRLKSNQIIMLKYDKSVAL